MKSIKNICNPYIISILIAILQIQTSCSKLVDVDVPTTSISAKNVYTNDATASAVLTGIYATISASNITGNDLSAIGFATGLCGDELTLYSGVSDTRLLAYYQNNLKTITSYYDFWTTFYKEIYILNLSIEGLNSSTALTPSIKQQLLGEAKFLRAFIYFYLVNLYGDVPLAISSDYSKNNILSRSPEKDIWLQIISDLKEAKGLLSPNYLDGTLLRKTTQRVRPTQWAAVALLARSYLYVKDWKNAEIEASTIIENKSLYSLDSIQNVFLMNSNESIWQLQPVNMGSNTEDAKTYILRPTGPTSEKPAYLSAQLMNSFEPNDLRRKVWTDTVMYAGILYYYPYKYKSGILNEPLTEYNTVLRLGEQYLIRSEARAQQNNLKGALDDLNIIRLRAGLKESKLSETSALLIAIYHERQLELLTEWGHRWLDLKRTETVDKVMSEVTPLKGGAWSSNWKLFPILSSDILKDGNLIQNSGY